MPKELVELNINAIDEGLLVGLVNIALRDVADNIVLRPQNKKERVVTLTIRVKPDETPVEGVPEMPSIDYTVDTKVPGRSGRTSRAFLQDGRILINPGDGTNPLQTAMDFESPDNVIELRKQG